MNINTAIFPGKDSCVCVSVILLYRTQVFKDNDFEGVEKTWPGNVQSDHISVSLQTQPHGTFPTLSPVRTLFPQSVPELLHRHLHPFWGTPALVPAWTRPTLKHTFSECSSLDFSYFFWWKKKRDFHTGHDLFLTWTKRFIILKCNKKNKKNWNKKKVMSGLETHSGKWINENENVTTTLLFKIEHILS